MPNTPNPLFERWRLASAAAEAADTANFAKAIASLDGKCPPPTEEEWEAAKALRHQATEILALLRASYSVSQQTTASPAPPGSPSP
ncbi:MAG: hypothetical protein K0R89_1560 [Ramlibacter sp.]|jgi:hypothetical protein|nr:hypothetical protein [Ramlibacter sp.]